MKPQLLQEQQDRVQGQAVMLAPANGKAISEILKTVTDFTDALARTETEKSLSVMISSAQMDLHLMKRTAFVTGRIKVLPVMQEVVRGEEELVEMVKSMETKQ